MLYFYFLLFYTVNLTEYSNLGRTYKKIGIVEFVLVDMLRTVKAK